MIKKYKKREENITHSNQSLRQLQAEGIVELLIEKIEHVIARRPSLPFLVLLLHQCRRRYATQKLLPLLRLLLLSQRHVRLDRTDGRD